MAAALLAAMTTACSEDMPVEDPQGPQPGSVTFRFRMQGDAQGALDFIATTSDASLIVRAREQLQLPEGSRNLHINGAILAAAAGENLGWGWRFRSDDWQLASISMELCDGNAQLVQQDLAYWLNTVRRFCPWGSHVAGEVVGLAAASGVIVKFTVQPTPAVLEQRVQAMQQIADERGLVLTYRSAGALDAHVLDLGWVISTEQTRSLAQAIVARVPDVEYADPNVLLHPTGSP